jgi:hypothetical protein
MVRAEKPTDTSSQCERDGFTKDARGEMMKSISIYAGNQGWFYEIWISSRLVVFGWCADRDRAQHAARTA